MSSVKIIDASLARNITLYKNLKRKILKCCANIYLNKKCCVLDLKYVFYIYIFNIHFNTIPVVCPGLSRNLFKKIQTGVYLTEEYRLVVSESVKSDRCIPTF